MAHDYYSWIAQVDRKRGTRLIIDLCEKRGIEADIEFYKLLNLYGKAAKLAEKHGMIEKAIIDYDIAGLYDDVRRLLKTRGDTKRAKRYDTLLRLLEKKIDPNKIDVIKLLNSLYTRRGKEFALSKLVENDIIPNDKESIEKIIQRCIDLDLHSLAVDLAINKLKDYILAYRICGYGSFDLKEKAGDLAKIIHERNIKSDKIIDDPINCYDIAIKHYIETHRYDEVPRVVQKYLDCIIRKYDNDEEAIRYFVEEAIGYLEKAKQYSKYAAEVAEKYGMIEETIEYLKGVGQHNDAAKLAEKHGMIEEAIINYEIAGSYKNVGRLLKKQGDTKRAKIYDTLSTLLENRSNFESATACV